MNAMRDKILDAAVECLRRFGPAKTTVSDVARALGMSHANVYRHFESKAALFEAVAERWLGALMPPLEAVLESARPAPDKLVAWLSTLHALKREKVSADPEMFAAYHAVAEASRMAVTAHVQHLRDHVAAILAEGVAAGEFAATDVTAGAEAVLDATSRFHHPHFIREAAGQDVTAQAARVFALVVAGLRRGAERP